jgi:Ca2+-binding EF-hand superfamily protein
MGCGGSKVMDDGDPHNDIAKLQLSSKELKAFRKAFNSIDKDKSGSINVKEFIESLGVQRTVVSEEVFEDMDTSNDGTVSFKEFTLLTWRFCTRGLDSIAEFAFDIYDTDNSEQLTKPEIRELIIEAYGKITEKHNVSDV